LSDRAETIAEPEVALPPILGAELTAPEPPTRPWYLTLFPAFLGLFVWAPLFDQLWVGDLPRHGLPWLARSAIVGPVLCYLIFLQTAGWGFRARRRLGLVAASTFGAAGSEWIVGVAVALANVVWWAVGVDFAVDSILLGLRACDLLAPGALEGWSSGALHVKAPVYLGTLLFWYYITGLSVRLRLTGVVVALMKVYAPIALLLLSAVGLYCVTVLGSPRAGAGPLVATAPHLSEGWAGGASALQTICGFFAVASLVSVDWGAVARSQRDLVLGGLTGIVAAGCWTSVMSLLVVAGAASSPRLEGTTILPGLSAPPFSFRWSVFYGIGGLPAAVILVLFGLAALAPACYSAWSFSEKLAAHRPLRRSSRWIWIGAAAAFVLAATSCAGRLGLIASVMGDVFAPVAGALCGDRLRQHARWRGLRPGVNPAGVVAWAVGCALAAALEAASSMYPEQNAWFQPASIYGFVASALVYWLASGDRFERPTVPLTADRLER
jgi:cytosine permease